MLAEAAEVHATVGRRASSIFLLTSLHSVREQDRLTLRLFIVAIVTSQESQNLSTIKCPPQKEGLCIQIQN